MGLKPSPYASVQSAMRAQLVMLGDWCNSSNPFHWSRWVFNLPGTIKYDPILPWAYRVREDSTLASSVLIYVNDLRVTAPPAELAWKASSKIGKVCSFLGLQDAARKRREPSQSPGAWAGSVMESISGRPVFKLVSKERWRKTQQIINWFATQISLDVKDVYSDLMISGELKSAEKEHESGRLDRQKAESFRGFLVYVLHTYTGMVPYLKGIHLTIDSWRPDRDEDGWRISNCYDRKLLLETTLEEAPDLVIPVHRLRDDIDMLLQLTSFKDPPKIPIRPTDTRVAKVSDASGQGFGSSLWEPTNRILEVVQGRWIDDIALERSSNFRELHNLIISIEDYISKGKLDKGCEVFGTSKRSKL